MTKKIFRIFLAGCLILTVACKKSGPSLSTADVYNEADIFPAPPGKWFGGSNPHYTAAGYVGDVIPYYDKDSFHIFYLHDARDGAAGFHPWSKFTTQTLTSYDYDGVMIPYGGTSDYDLALGTGSIVKAGGVYYAFYSGYNPNFTGAGGKYRDNIMYATSTDLDNWTKQPGFLMKPETTNGYNFWEYRDPYVFYNSEAGAYWMLVCGRKDDAAAVMLYTSADPASGQWQLQAPVYTTTDYYVPETPEMFKWGNYWYLLFSDNSVENVTRYRIASSSSGPWITPANDKLDGPYMYASKTATDGTNTYLFGWCATKAGLTDNGARDFGGNLVTHRLTQNSDGTLNVQSVPAVAAAFSKVARPSLTLRQQDISVTDSSVVFPASDERAYILYDRVQGEHMIQATVTGISAGAGFGLVFGMDKALQNSSYYQVRFDQSSGLVSGNPVTGGAVGTDGFVPFTLTPGESYDLKVIFEGTVCVVYINDQVALTSRIYSMPGNFWGLFAEKGTVRFDHLQYRSL